MGSRSRHGVRPDHGARAARRPVRILFVCLGNICRSPTAEGVLRALAARERIDGEIEVESAGTGGWHIGSPPDVRASAAARARGIVLEGSARQVVPEDLDRFDLVIAMDRENLRELRALARDEEQLAKIRLLREFDPGRDGDEGELDVPDPYYGAAGGFEEVLEIVEAACGELLRRVASGELP
jgi:protein-tyrosine phosphatase